MKIKGILFDKDGTLIDFFSLWLEAANNVVLNILNTNNIEAKEEIIRGMFESIGVINGVVDPKGALAFKPYFEMGYEIHKFLESKGYNIDHKKISKQLEELFDEEVNKEDATLKELYNLDLLFTSLKEKNIYIGLATADTLTSANNCLERLNIKKYFDFIGSDDGVYRPKPEKDMLDAFCNKCNLKPEEVAIVGDTENDMQFATKNNALAVGVLSGVSSKEDLKLHADIIINNVGNIIESNFLFEE